MKKICSIHGCDNKHEARGYCQKHYRQFMKYGKIPERTLQDKNDFIILKDYAIMNLYNKNGEKIKEVLIDIEDVEYVGQYKWSIGASGKYVSSWGNGTRILLHRFIMNPPKNKIVDHINRDTFDNRKCNLRIATRSQNAMNTKLRADNSSGYKGVYYLKNRNRWRIEITIAGECHVAFSKTKEEAIQKRKEMELEYHGEFASSWWEENQCQNLS